MNALPFYAPGYITVPPVLPELDLLSAGLDADVTVGTISNWIKSDSWTHIRIEHQFNVVAVSTSNTVELSVFCDITPTAGSTTTQRHDLGGILLFFPSSGGRRAQQTLSSVYIDTIQHPKSLPAGSYNIEFKTQVSNPDPAAPIILEVQRNKNTSCWFSVQEIPYG
jgi:hypothetical protein